MTDQHAEKLWAESGKMVVIGLDGATPNLVEPWMAEGKLPNLAHLAKTGAYGRLRSTMQPSSPEAWASFLTGRNPGKHGIFGFARRRPGTYLWEPVHSGHRRGESLAQMVSAYGKRVGFLYVPLTYPPEPVNGFVISGLGTPGPHSAFAYPPQLKNDLLQIFKPDQLLEPSLIDQTLDEYLANLERSIENNWSVLRYLEQRYPSLDLLVAVFMAPDRVQHFTWHYIDPTYPAYRFKAPAELREAILRVYQRVDEIVGEITSGLDDETTLLIISDHGAGPYQKFVDLNCWLEREGYLVAARAEVGRLDRLVTQLYRLWQRGPRAMFSARERRALIRFLPPFITDRLQSRWRNPIATWVDWSRTRAFSEVGTGYISLNQQGREPQGLVSAGAEREALLTEISDRLYALRDPDTGEPVVGRVFRREELYHGAALDCAPDLIIEWRNEQYTTQALWTRDGKVFRTPMQWPTMQLAKTGHHLRDGILFAKGPSVPAGLRVEGGEIIDLAPTILHLLGLPLPGDFDGRVLEELCVGMPPPAPTSEARVDEETQFAHVTQAGQVYSADEQQQIEEMLRGLGYME